MILIPAIDLKDKKVVRLITGAADQKKDYGDDPLIFAKQFEEEGAEWLHVIDLDGAFSGTPQNLAHLERIRRETKLKIEFGGGLRSQESIDTVLSLGVNRVILGTRSLDGKFLSEAVAKHGEKIAVSLDARDGMVQVQGWTEKSKVSIEEFITFVKKINVSYLIYTDISKDGTLSGPNLNGLQKVLAQAGDVDVTLSGGISSLQDLKEVSQLKEKNLWGVITGRALYEKRITVSEGVKIFQAAG